ncbi:MAG TPA: PAS domain S-box protein, partial [Spirochaetota bacterium]|nr:PAS domain S-box protein [Spirochaetota bacterium]
LYINESAARWGRKKRDELIGRTVTECYPGIESQPVFTVLSECMTERTRRREEIEFTFSDGSTALFEFFIHPVPEGLFVLNMDITERKMYETILHESEQRFRALVENSPDGIFIQTNGLFAYANESMRKMVDPAGGHSLVGEEVIRFFAPEYRDIVSERLRLLNIERRAVPRNEEVLVDVNGNRIIADIIASPIEFNGVQGALVYVHDISIRKRTENELQQMIKLKDTLMAELQHRVKNSLAIINSLISFESSKLTDEATKQVFANAQSRIHVMAGIYEMLYSSQETSLNSVRLDMYVYKLTSTIINMCDTGNRMALSFDMDEVSFDLKRTVIVCLILNELVTNAIKHSCAIDMTCAVFISLKMEGNILELTVTDTGSSKPDIEPKTGTGLSLVRLLMKEIHAEMKTSNANGYNTSITFPYRIA